MIAALPVKTMCMSIALILPERDIEQLHAALKALAPEVPVQVWPDLSEPESVRLAVVWYPPAEAFEQLSNLRAVLNYGAGVDGLVDNPAVPSGVALGRILLDSLHQQMTTYCLAAALPQLREFPRYRKQQSDGKWRQHPPRQATVGLLGYGYLGHHVASALRQLGYPVIAWSRSGRSGEDGVRSVQGDDGLATLLEQSDCVICLLPLTDATRGMLDAATLAQMRPGSHLINVARGAIVVENDLLQALANDRPGFATLDVFENEPLPAAHPFWDHPKITMTPHIASLTMPLEAAGAVVRNYRRVLSGHGPEQPVSRDSGY